MGQKVKGPEYDSPNGGPPASFFAASSSLPVAGLEAAAAHASVVPEYANYPIDHGSSVISTIHSDWAKYTSGAAYSWVADMDVDCDGIDYKCRGNPDGQPRTNWGALAAYEVPFIVIPQKFLDHNSAALKGNNVAAVICNGKMYYGILGDANGDHPQITGEASWLMARTCFPGDDLNGNKGHTAANVTYILFTGNESILPRSSLNKNYITNFDTLCTMGDRLVGNLTYQLGLLGTKPPTTLTTTTSAAQSTSTDHDCSDELTCLNGKCAIDDEAESCC